MIAIVVCCTVACSSTKVLVDEKKLWNTLPALPVSTLNVPVSVFAKPFLAQAESIAPTEFTSTGWPSYLQTSCDFRYKYRFVRSGFAIKCNNSKLQIIMNGSYQIAGSKAVCAFDKQVSPWVNGSCGFGNEPMRKVQIVIGSQLTFGNDYTIKSVTKAEKVQAIDKCLVSILNTDMTAEVMDSIKVAVNDFGFQMDQTLSGMDFSATTQQLALQLGKKNAIKNYGYIKANPAAVSIDQLNIIGDTLYTTLGIKAYPEVSSDSTNHQVTNFLPPLKTEKLLPGIFLNVNALYDFNTLDTIINQTLRNKTFDISGNKVLIKNVDIEGITGHKINLRVDFAGSKTGTVFLTGTPVLDVEKQILSIPDITYNLSSSDVALNMGKKFFNKKILQTIREKATINVAEIYKKNKPKLDATLNRQIKAGISTTGYTTGVRLLALVVKQEGVQVQASINGQVMVLVSQL